MTAPRLSLCVIVRDEEAMLPDLLASVDGLWDELVAVDTGSTDGTVALLESAGARVIPYAWDDDFAAARNASLAPATGDWILFLDADERVTPALRTGIRAILADRKAGAATVTLRNALPGGHHRDASLLRLFRNDPAIRFRHRIHEDVLDDVEAYLARTGQELRHLAGVVEHLGYVREVAADRDKKTRDETLLRRALAEDPDDFYCWFKLLELARFWEDAALGNETAQAVAPRFAGPLSADQLRALRRNPWSGELAVLIARGLGLDAAAARAWLETHADRVRQASAWHLGCGRLAEDAADTEAAARSYRACLADTTASAAPHHVRAHLGLGRLAGAAGRHDEGLDQVQAALATAPADPEALLGLVMFSTLGWGPDAAVENVRAHVRQHPAATRPAAEALLESGQAAAALAILEPAVAQEPELALGVLTCALVLGQDIGLDVDLDQATADRAFKAWIRHLWQGRRPDLMAAFADHAGGVTGVFPWLEEFLAAETARLRAR